MKSKNDKLLIKKYYNDRSLFFASNSCLALLCNVYHQSCFYVRFCGYDVIPFLVAVCCLFRYCIKIHTAKVKTIDNIASFFLSTLPFLFCSVIECDFFDSFPIIQINCRMFFFVLFAVLPPSFNSCVFVSSSAVSVGIVVALNSMPLKTPPPSAQIMPFHIISFCIQYSSFYGHFTCIWNTLYSLSEYTVNIQSYKLNKQRIGLTVNGLCGTR